MEQKATTESAESRPQITLIAESADDFLFDTLDADEFSDLEFYTSDEGELLATAEGTDAYVRLNAGEELEFEEVADIDENEVTEIDIAEPQPASTDLNGRTRLRGD